MRVLLIGGTGLIGGQLCQRLLSQDVEVHALLRRSSGRTHALLHEHVAPPGHWPELAASLGGDAAVSALGTTMRKAGSEAAFRAVDQDMVLAFARAAREAEIPHFLTISSIGANAGSSNFYLRIKGEVEEALKRLSFRRLDIFRPGLLVGERGGDRRVAERIGIVLSPLTNRLLRGRLDRFAAISAATVAEAVAQAMLASGSGTFVHENRAIRELARL